MLKTVLGLTLAAVVALPAQAACDPAKLPEFWSCPGAPPLRDRAREELIASTHNPYAYDSHKPATAVFLVAGPMVAAVAGLAFVTMVTQAPITAGGPRLIPVAAP